MQVEVARILLLVIAVVVTFGTPVADLNERHVFNAAWPPHARFHCAAHALMNVGCGGLSIGLLLTTSPQERLLRIVIAAVLLAWSGLCLHVALLFPGTSAIAGPREPIVRGWPISLWFSGAVVLLTVLGAGLALTG